MQTEEQKTGRVGNEATTDVILERREQGKRKGYAYTSGGFT